MPFNSGSTTEHAQDSISTYLSLPSPDTPLRTLLIHFLPHYAPRFADLPDHRYWRQRGCQELGVFGPCAFSAFWCELFALSPRGTTLSV